MHWIAIAVGGAIGAMARYSVSLGAARWGGEHPWGTLIANLLGCLLLGMLSEWVVTNESLSAWQQKALGVGFLGALTTFSTFANETVRLWEQGKTLSALAHVGLNLGLGLLAVGLGIWLIRRPA